MWQHVLLLVLVAAIEALVPSRPNILHLMADDMRPQLQSYGHAFMQTPHLQRLAQTGLQFDFAYTQYGVCAPSRNSFMVMHAIQCSHHQPMKPAAALGSQPDSARHIACPCSTTD